ncbi:hypothetical protein VHEMI10396 [[Torrubiella] hemipterigena]|uniref:Major facilitator superfamily (MFS) profile domain-containing protein n=1 Tax=[Torrubiella] hemipterigena TaxID=1531966 RepID=A0A0A1TIN5_9HYPO|nr:hypothetical protein VHEMI10396 [[Torrubiella] hemipterigena]
MKQSQQSETINSSALIELNLVPENRPTDEVSIVDTSPDYPTGLTLWLVLVTVGAIIVLASIDINIVATAVPSITDHFHTVEHVGWYSSAFRLCMCAFQFIFGKAYTIFPVKRVFLLSNFISIVGSIICGAATSSMMLIIGRAVAGLASAGLFAGCLVILAQSLPLHRRPLVLGIISGLEGTTIMAAPLLGGAISQSWSWRWCFFINAPIGIVSLALTMYCVKDVPTSTAATEKTSLRAKVKQLDLLSTALLLPSLTSLFLALSWVGVKFAWNSTEMILLFIVFGVLLLLFIYHQTRRGDDATLPPRIMKRRTVIAGFLFIMFTNSASNVLEYYLPTFYQTVRGFSPAQSGYMMLPVLIGATIGAVTHGAGTSWLGYYAPFMLFTSIILPISTGLITSVAVDTSVVKLIMYTGLSGFAYGIGFSGPQNAVQTVLPQEDIPLGLSAMLFAQSFGPSVAIVGAQTIFTSQLSVNLEGIAPGLNRMALAEKGLIELISEVPASDVEKVILQIHRSIVPTWYLVVALACLTIFGSAAIEWRSVKAKID